MARSFIGKLTEACQKRARIFIGKLSESCQNSHRKIDRKWPELTPNYMAGTKSRPATPVRRLRGRAANSATIRSETRRGFHVELPGSTREPDGRR